MKKEQIYVVIDSEEKRLRAIQILSDAGEKIWEGSVFFKPFETIENMGISSYDGFWRAIGYTSKTEITLDQLEQLLNPNFVVKEVVLSIYELQKQAESLGFELVKKERQIKVGDFGKFESESRIYSTFGFLKNIDEKGILFEEHTQGMTSNWSKFRHLTEEEKANIQENW